MIPNRLAAMSVMGLFLLGAHPLRILHKDGPILHTKRFASTDLEVAGMLKGVPSGEPMYVRYDDLLTLPQETYTVSDDPNFVGTVTISGVPLESLPKLLGAAPEATMVTAICDDAYAAHYPPEYLKAHHAILVLKVNGKPPAQWPVGADGAAMGPYMVSHPSFKPSFSVLSHTDEAQVPWGVMRLEFVDPSQVYIGIDPLKLRVPHNGDPQVLQGYAIARQNCFRCHGRTEEGGTKSGRSWESVGRTAVADPKYFDAYVRNPKSMEPQSEMAASPQYDAATLEALRAYFSLFAKEGTP